MGKRPNTDTIEQFKYTQIIQKYYDEYKQIHPVELPHLHIKFIRNFKSTTTMQVEKFHGREQLVQLTVNIPGAQIRKLDLKATCFHEFTHILDFYLCDSYKDQRHQYYTTLSEIHAAYEEMVCRLKLSEDSEPSLKTCIPVLSQRQTVDDYMHDEFNDVIAFYKQAVQDKDVDAAARFWKHLQYYCGYNLCLIDSGIEVCTDLEGIPTDFDTSIMNCGICFMKNQKVFTEPTDEILGHYYRAEKALYGLILAN